MRLIWILAIWSVAIAAGCDGGSSDNGRDGDEPASDAGANGGVDQSPPDTGRPEDAGPGSSPGDGDDTDDTDDTDDDTDSPDPTAAAGPPGLAPGSALITPAGTASSPSYRMSATLGVTFGDPPTATSPHFRLTASPITLVGEN
jgi:hypothetical protein